MDWKNVRVFISSTFNDMHSERDYLVKNVFPELSQWCEQRRLRLTDIDLRWGITSADSTAKNTVKACLENIDRSRPFFLCFLGQRRGWVPEETDVGETTLERFPGLKDYVGGYSVTEMEIEHALLSPMYKILEGHPASPSPVDHALFFFRQDDFTDRLSEKQRLIYTNDAVSQSGGDPQAEDRKLDELKSKVKARVPAAEYSCRWNEKQQTPELLAETNGAEISQGRLTDFEVSRSALGEELWRLVTDTLRREFPEAELSERSLPLKYVVLAQLTNEIIKEFPERAEIKSYTIPETDLEQQRQFIYLNTEGFIARPDIFDELDEYLNSADNRICVVTAQAGMGKTMLLANYAVRVGARRRTLARFCGVSDLSSEQFNLWKSIFDEAGISIPANMEDLRREMPTLLSKLSQDSETVIIIDAINQLPGGMNMLTWLPKRLPEKLKIILSLKSGEQLNSIVDALKQDSGVRECSIGPFEEKERLIDDYLELSFKALDDEQVKLICSLPYSNNPLFLKILLHELRMFGSFRQLEDEITRYGENPYSAFDAVLRRLEKDPVYDAIDPEKSVPLLFGLIADARKGLSEEELLRCFKMSFPTETDGKIKGTIRFFLRQVRPFMARREGRVDFLYESFALAARDRYVNALPKLDSQLAQCFRSFCDTGNDGYFSCGLPDEQRARPLCEYAYHLFKSDPSAAERLYASIPYLNERCSYSSVGELLSEYDRLSSSEAILYRDCILRHAQTLTKYRNSLFSILNFSGFGAAQEQIGQIIASGKWDRPFICARTLKTFMQKTDGQQSGAAAKMLAETKLFQTVAVCAASERDLAFYSEGNGRVRIFDTASFTSCDIVIPARDLRPLSMAASCDGKHLVISYEDEIAQTIEISYDDKGAPYHSRETTISAYYLPLYDNGIFAFEGEKFWYQWKEDTLVIKDFATPLWDESYHKLDFPGELSSLVFAADDAIYSIRQSNRTVFCTAKGGKSRVFEGVDVTKAVALENSVAIAFSDMSIVILDAGLEIQQQSKADASVAAMCCVGDELLIITKAYNGSYGAVLWNHTVNVQRELIIGSAVSCNSQMCLTAVSDGNICAVSDNGIWKFCLSDDMQAQEASIIAAALGGNDQGLLAVTVERNELTLHTGMQEKKLPHEYRSSWTKVLFADNAVTALDAHGEGCVVSLETLSAFSVNLQASVSAACQGGDGCLYYCELIGNLRCAESGMRIDLSGYHMNDISMYAFGKYIVLTGNSTAANTMSTAETGHETSTRLILFYEIVQRGKLRLVGERLFFTSKGVFLGVTYSSRNDWFYIMFHTPNTGKTFEPPLLCYGTANEILSKRERQKVLGCTKNKLSMSCIGDSLLICNDGLISAFDAQSLEYMTTLAADSPMRFIEQAPEPAGSAVAVCGEGSAVEIKIIKT